jgi:hypothetical protein
MLSIWLLLAVVVVAHLLVVVQVDTGAVFVMKTLVGVHRQKACWLLLLE